MSRLPGSRTTSAPTPTATCGAAEVVGLLDGYARAFGAPVLPHTTVVGVRPTASGFRVDDRRRPWRCRRRRRGDGQPKASRGSPPLAGELAGDLQQVTALGYREPGQLAPGAVLVVGASASGVQIADELRRAGRSVTLAVGDHVRVPRTYRGRDIYWWMDELGSSTSATTRSTTSSGPGGCRRCSWWARPQRRSLDLATLSAGGVQLTGRLVGIDRGRAQFSGSLANLLKAADLKQARLLDRIDEHVGPAGRGRSGRTAAADPLPAGDRAGPRPVLRRGLGHRAPAPLPLARPGACSTAAARSAMTAGCWRLRACTCSGYRSPADAAPT